MTKEYQAYASGKTSTHASTPKQAALMFFEANPNARKCNIIEGKSDGYFFTVTYGKTSNGGWPFSAKEVTKKNLNDLPDND